ncbi:MAG: hypothetical protein JW875_09060 [Spirochaetales bacterium]|nr:hypothetical protein [Spirochaetales bacterium]
MTELQPTEIELTGKKRTPRSISHRRIIAAIVIAVIVMVLGALTAVMAYRASTTPAVMQPTTLPPETAEIISSD